MRSKIIGTGACHSLVDVPNSHFAEHVFFDEAGEKLKDSLKVINKLEAITGIAARRYAKDNKVASDLAFEAAEAAIQNAEIDKESIDYIIVTHNYGDIPKGTRQSDMVPSIAARVKHLLGIKNNSCIAYDMIFGCAGWIESVIHADAFIRSGLAKRCLVIGVDVLSRVIDPADRDSMIFADGAGAGILELTSLDTGILATASATFSLDEVDYINFEGSYNEEESPGRRYIKMKGRKIYEFALVEVPAAMKSCLDKAGIDIDDLKKVFIHQANEKMDQAILDRFYKLYDKTAPEGIMPMNIKDFGNSSVATVPTLYDMVRRGQVEGQELNKGDIILFAAVGAGMSLNAIVYRVD